jgi:hypothetical protein
MERIIFTRPRLCETAHMAGFDQDTNAQLTLMPKGDDDEVPL